MIGTDIKIAKRFLEEGEAIGLPTETVYGLAANALNEDAVHKVFAIKNRPNYDPLITHLKSKEEIYKYATIVDSRIASLIEDFWPGPLTVLLPKKEIISDLVTSGLPHAAFRVPNHPLALELLHILDFPLVAPSANPFMYVSPTTAMHVATSLKDKIPYILDGGACKIGLESTIVGIENNQVTMFRKGGISIEEISKIVGDVVIKESSSSQPQAPGMMLHHYAPAVPLIRGDVKDLLLKNSGKRIGVISFSMDYSMYPTIMHQIILSPAGDLNEAARHLFSAMRDMDAEELDLIVTEYFPDLGLGKAINDRLTRASLK